MFEVLLAFFLALGGFSSIEQLPVKQQEMLRSDCDCSQLYEKSGVDYDTWKGWCLEYEAREKDGGVITVELGAS